MYPITAEAASTSNDTSALIISLIALVIAVVAAGFTGWQAYEAHKTRADSRSVHLSLASTQRFDLRRVWFVLNSGASPALNPVVTFTLETDHVCRRWVGTVPDVVNGQSRAQLVFSGEEWPAPERKLSGSGETVWGSSQIVVEFGTIHTDKRTRRSIGLS